MNPVNNRVAKIDLSAHFVVSDPVMKNEIITHVDVNCRESISQVQSQKGNVISRQLLKPETPHLVLSTFSGIDLLGRGFKASGFCVVQSGDIILDNDIRHFHPPEGKFEGVVGGPPCQDFSKLRRIAPTGYGLEMIEEFKRVVLESDCNWFVMENVPQVPDIEIEGYVIQRFALSPHEIGYAQRRRRHFQFGSKQGNELIFQRKIYKGELEPCLLATDGKRKHKKGFEEFCQLQGLDYVPDLADLTKAGRYKVIGNAVHLKVATTVAEAVRESTYNHNRKFGTGFKTCLCGCGEILIGREIMKTATCRKRMQIKREYAAVKEKSKN